jgi:hypothetical protein
MLSLKMERTTADADTCIFENNRMSTQRCIFYIKEGVGKFYLEPRFKSLVSVGDREKVLNLTNVERVLGVYEFITGQNYSICCRSIDLCLIQSLPWPAFMEVLQQLKITVAHSLPRNSSTNCSTACSPSNNCSSSTSSAWSASKDTSKPTARTCTTAKPSKTISADC